MFGAGCPAASARAFTRLMPCARSIPHGLRRTWSGYSLCWPRASSIRASRKELGSMRSRKGIAALKRVVLRGSSSCARTCRHGPSGSSARDILPQRDEFLRLVVGLGNRRDVEREILSGPEIIRCLYARCEPQSSEVRRVLDNGAEG